MSTKDELAGLRSFLATLEHPRTEYRIAGQDVRKREAGILQREIACLESLLNRARGPNAQRP